MSRIGLNYCNCFAVRKASRHLTQIYDLQLASVGIRVTQYMILRSLDRDEVMSVNALADEMAMDRTTMGKNLRPLERDGLVEVLVSKNDRRSRDILLTRKGILLLKRAYPLWRRAHKAFQQKHGEKFTEALRSMLREVSAHS